MDSPRRAQSFTRELREKARRISNVPRAFPLHQRHENSGIRVRPHGNYLIFYRVEASRILIVDIIHGARDYEALLFPPDEGERQ